VKITHYYVVSMYKFIAMHHAEIVNISDVVDTASKLKGLRTRGQLAIL
jgi:hypothetical protein